VSADGRTPAGESRRLTDQVLLYLQKLRYYERNTLPWRMLRLHWHFLRRDAFLRFPVQGNLLEALDEGRAEIGPAVLIEPGCWFALYPETARLSIGEGTIVNLGCMLAATERISVGRHCMFANYCFVADAEHRYDDPDLPVTWQGMMSKGPVTIGDSCWFGTNCVVTGGVTIGERTVVGANSVVTRDLPRGVIAAGAPARVIREIEFRSSASESEAEGG
jgi:acetyltransferase-like isoleucine patch superfamily enzyme